VAEPARSHAAAQGRCLVTAGAHDAPFDVDRRAEGLAVAARTHRDELLAMAEPLAARDDVSVDVAPDPRTVMSVLDGPIGRQCLAEVVVTVTTVTVGDRSGWGCVLGWDAEAALAAALLDAADPVAADRLAEEALGLAERERAARTAQVRMTRLEIA
jgi:alpha-D-ribose 1-methylphosphonate 5-triphosphate synthase subunit PhnG